MLNHLPLHLLLVISAAVAYNLDVDNLRLFTYPDGDSRGNSRASYFGFSVALMGKNGLIVGAPRANSTLPGGRIFHEPGVVYRCYPTTETDGSCEEANMDPWYNTTRVIRKVLVTQKRDGAWFGGTLSIAEDVVSNEIRIVVCAPRWQQNLFDGSTNHWFMNGMCMSLLSSRPNSSYHHVPLIDDNHQVIEFHRNLLYFYGMGQAGFSAVATTKDLVLGAPGMFYWSGTALEVQSLTDQFAALIPKVVGDPRLETHGYFGYSLTSGYYYTRTKIYYAAGAPRMANVFGKVFIFTFPRYKEDHLVYKAEFQGEQHGEYFGGSLASCDVNGDGRDDLLVGAPLWSNEGDEGRVYVHMSKGQKAFEIHRIDGETAGGRFGTSIICLGDLDRDGYADVAISAPYEDHGVVYIYNGNVEGRLKMTQFVRAPRDQMRGFGIAISAPRDVDGNGYNDIAIGAPLSDHVVLLKSRSVVVMSVELSVDDNFVLIDTTTDFRVIVKAKYDGAVVPETLNAMVELTIDKVHKRALVYHNNRIFVGTFKFATTLKRGEQKSIPVKITLKKNNKNMIDPINLSAWISSNESASNPSTPVISPTLSRISDDLQLAYSLDCGEDKICEPELHVDIKVNNESSNEVRYTVGSRSSLNVSVIAMNKGEAAYGTDAHVLVPEPIGLARIPPECHEVRELENKTIRVVCNVGNPLRYTENNGTKTLVMELDMSEVQFTNEAAVIHVILISLNQFTVNASLNIVYENDADLAIIGKSYDEWYSYLEQDAAEDNLRTITFDHVYEILKYGVSPVQDAQLTLRVPTHWRDTSVAQIVRIQGTVDGREYVCNNVTEEVAWNATSTDVFSMDDTLQYNEGNDSLLATPAPGRTFYINCTDQEVTCEAFSCSLGSLVKPQSAAKLAVTIDIQISKLIVQAMKEKDIIFFVTEGFVKITQSNIAIVSSSNKPDFKQIATVLLSRREPEKVAIWIIILSVLLGIILLCLLTFLLFKLGFFNRTETPDREVLKPKETSENMDGHENSESNIEGESTDGT